MPHRSRACRLFATGVSPEPCRPLACHKAPSPSIGVDSSHVFLTATRYRTGELDVADRVRFEHGDAGEYRATATFDVVSCIGATWIGGRLAGTLALMRPALNPGGLLLVGEPYWTEDPPEAAYPALDVKPDDFTSLVGTMDRRTAAGCELIEMVLADGDSRDRYAAAGTATPPPNGAPSATG